MKKGVDRGLMTNLICLKWYFLGRADTSPYSLRPLTLKKPLAAYLPKCASYTFMNNESPIRGSLVYSYVQWNQFYSSECRKTMKFFLLFPVGGNMCSEQFNKLLEVLHSNVTASTVCMKPLSETRTYIIRLNRIRCVALIAKYSPWCGSLFSFEQNIKRASSSSKR